MQQFKILILFCFCFFFQNTFAKQHFALFMVVKGDVKVFLPNGTEKKVITGLEVFERDRIVVGAESSAKLVTLDRNVLVIGEKSVVMIEKYQSQDSKNKNVSIKINEGSLRSSLRQTYDSKSEYYHISTPSSVTGVRGTDFYVEYNIATKENIICTFTGNVSYKPEGAKTDVVIGAGKFVRHKAGQEIKVSEPKPTWVEKTLKTLEVTGNEEPPDSSIKSVK
jgi:hypothetical protein